MEQKSRGGLQAFGQISLHPIWEDEGEYHTLPNIVQMSSRAFQLSSSVCLIYSFHVRGAKMVLISNHSYCSAGTFH